MRGISAIIAVVLILLITISLAAGAYLFLSMTMSQTTTAAQQGISQTMTQMTKSFTIEAVDGPRISIRNTGQAQLSNFSVYVDNSLVNTSQVSIAPDEVKTILIYDFIDFSQSREIKVVSGTLAQTKIVSKQDSTLVGYWKFDEGNGTTAADSSGNGNDGTLVNGPTWIADGKYGKALYFDGVDDRVTTISSTGSTSAVTVEAWIKEATANSNAGLVFDTNWSYGIWIQNSKIQGGIWNASSYQHTASSQVIPQTGIWYHIAMTYDMTTDHIVRLYVNGTLAANWTAIGPTKIPNKVDVGGRNPNNWYFNGTIDEVRIYNRALSADEIWNHYVHGPI